MVANALTNKSLYLPAFTLRDKGCFHYRKLPFPPHGNCRFQREETVVPIVRNSRSHCRKLPFPLRETLVPIIGNAHSHRKTLFESYNDERKKEGKVEWGPCLSCDCIKVGISLLL